MFTHTFQFFFVLWTLSVVVVAILTYRADRREVVKNADRAFQLANEFVHRRIEAGYYGDRSRNLQQIKKDRDDKYIELISK